MSATAFIRPIRLRFLIGFEHGKNDFVEGSKILLNTDLKIILLGHQNNAAKNFDTLV